MNMPNDNVILLSVVNTKLRDYYKDLDELVDDLGWDKKEILKKLESISYTYNTDKNQFV